MPTREQQTEYLFKTCQDLYHKGLVKARGVGPERSAAFAAGFVYGRMAMLVRTLQQGAFEQDLLDGFNLGIQAGEQAFVPPKWSLGPYAQDDTEPLGHTIDVTVS